MYILHLAQIIIIIIHLGRLIAEQSGEIREGNFLLQRLSVLIQRFNAVLLHDSFVDEEAETGIPA